jgi:hypothetical protein
VEAGWALCALQRKKKGPTYERWQLEPIDADTAEGIEGAGLLHALSGTCALDLDHVENARAWLAERGVDLDALLDAPNAVKISSGTKGRAKLLYRLKAPLRTMKPEGSGLELRCASGSGTSVQDALPPSMHPSGRLYEWQYGDELLGDWSKPPPIPAALKVAWKALIDEAPAEAPSTAPASDTPLDRLERWIGGQNPDADYDAWVKVGMKLHKATGGAEEGLNLWDAWSATARRKQHSRDAPVYVKGGCRVHWLSFSNPKGKHVASLDAELPAEADEFDVVGEAPKPTEAAEAKAIQGLKAQRKDAIAKLEASVVYVVNSEKYFDLKRHRLIGSDSAIEHLFTSSMPLGKSGRMNPVKVLKNSTSKRLVEALGFHPGEGALFKVGYDTFANLYRNQLPKPIEPTKLECEKIDWCFDRINDPVYVKWLKQYYGHVVQRPGVKIKSAPLLWSETQRNGKSTLVKTIPALLVGQKYSTDVGPDLLQSTFNDYLQNAWHVNLLEFKVGSRGERAMLINKLKAYITDDMVPFHPKGSAGYTMPNHFFVTASGNDEDAAAVDNNDERWGIHEFKQPKFTNAERKWIYYEFLLLPRAAGVLRHYFLNLDLEGFFPAGSAPMTEAKQEMVRSSMPLDVELLTTMYEEQSEFFNRDVILLSELTAYVHKHCVAKPSITRIGRILAKAPFFGESLQFRVKEGRYRGVIIRNREKWKAASGHEIMKHIRDDDGEFDLLS